MIICIEGITNSGKSTLCNVIEHEKNFILANKMQKNSIVSQRVKTLTGPVENIEKFDSVTELLLYSTLLSEKSSIVNSLSGDILIDGFSLSVFSYFYCRYNIDIPFLKSIVDYSCRGIVPDVTFFLDVSLETILKRAVQSPFTRKDIGLEKYYSELSETYIRFLNNYSKTSYIIDCDRISTKEVYNKICQYMDWS